MTDTDRTWPDDLMLGDRIEVDGHTYEVVGTGPAEASLQRVDDDNITANVFRWAVTNAVEFELQRTLTQEEFKRYLSTDSDS